MVDDGSTDGSLAIARDYEKRDSRIHVFTQPNSGGCRARNLAFEKSTGDYIMYLDADDLMSDNKIEVQMKRLEEVGDPRAVATCPYKEFIDPSETDILNKDEGPLFRDFNNGIDLLEVAWNSGKCIVVSCWLTPRSVIIEAGPWNETLTKMQDAEFFWRVMCKCGSIVYCSLAHFFYRIGHSSVSRGGKFQESKLRSALNARILGAENVLQYRDNIQIRRGIAHLFSEVMLNSPYNSSYYNESKEWILRMGCTPKHPSPSGVVRFVESVIGYERLLWIKYFLIRIHLKKE